MRKAIFDRDILPVWGNRLLTEITADDLRALCGKVKDRGARNGHSRPRYRQADLRLCNSARREGGAYGKLRNDVARDKRLTAAHLVGKRTVENWPLAASVNTHPLGAWRNVVIMAMKAHHPGG
jgi:hypothetical protein